MNLFENLQNLYESENKELFTFNWERGSVNDNIIKYLKAKNIQFRYTNFNLEANINGQWVRFDYKVDSEYNLLHDEQTLVRVYINSDQNKINESYGMEQYSYVGPVYRFNKVYTTIKEPIFTVAKSYETAMRNICYQLKQKYNLQVGANLTIDKNKIKRNPEIEELTKEFEKEPENVETKINDPKYNFEDPDRNEEYVIESILSFDDWLDRNFNDLVKEYADKYEMSEEEVYNEDEDFEEYVNERYEDYYKNTNRYIDDENEILDEDF